ncbi:MAG: transporter [Desulfotomaculum sp. BICA1-6]|nr:MAG: transporter [Peptococcaceae bacterium BRH_c8a]KJS73565.1 MAG: transporter [Desulfotomaculum sp. BICA1-6]
MKNWQNNDQFIGIVSATGAYVLWGFLPIYWKLVQIVSPQEILAHRIVWSFVFLLVVLLVAGKMKSFVTELRDILAQPSKIIGVVLASVFITVNWFTYIWAVNHDHVVESSLGYYINPLVSVMLGIIVLKEKLSFWQVVSFILAAIGVLYMTVNFGTVPWIALILATSFGVYGLIKKMVHLGAITGITLETMLISPFMLTYLGFVHNSGGGAFGNVTPGITGLLMGAGVITAVPLILFAAGANRLPLTVIGFLQYIAPTLMLVIGVNLYHEPFTRVHLISFSLIWTALTIFSLAKTRIFVEHEPTVFKKIAVKKS